MKPPPAPWRRSALETCGALLLWYASAAGYLLIRTGTPGSDTPAADALRASCYAIPPNALELRAEWQLVLLAASLAAACGWLFATVRAPLARAILAWTGWETAQVAACSIGAWGLVVPMGSGLCLERFGYAPSLVLVAASLLIVHYRGGGLWQSQNRQ